jgi:adenylate cyclase
LAKGENLRFGHPEEALAEYDAALEIDPNLLFAYVNKGHALIVSGRAHEAFIPIEVAFRLSPKDPGAASWYYLFCHAHLHLREYKEAIEECRRSINMNNSFWYAYADLISAYGTTGQLEQARQTLAELNKVRSDFSVQWFRQLGYGYSSNPQFRREFDDILDGLRKGGVREQ